MKFTLNEKRAAEMALRSLSATAAAIYADTDPLDVFERDGLLYARGAFEVDGLTLEQFESYLVSWATPDIERNGEPLDLDAPEQSNLWDSIASYMDDEVREDVHGDLAPCTNVAFLLRYLELDPEFSNLLENEFSIEIY